MAPLGSGAPAQNAVNHTNYSDEYGPYVHQFARKTGKRIKSFALPDNLAISNLSPQKELFLIDLNGAQEVSHVSGDLSAYAVKKTLFLNIVSALTVTGINPYSIPSKIEGVAFGQDVVINGETKHTLYIANDNDFLGTIADPLKLPGDASRGTVANPNVLYVFAFGDDDLPGYVPQKFQMSHEKWCTDD